MFEGWFCSLELSEVGSNCIKDKVAAAELPSIAAASCPPGWVVVHSDPGHGA